MLGLCICHFTSNVLQCDGDARRHLSRDPEGPETKLLVSTNPYKAKHQTPFVKTWSTEHLHIQIIIPFVLFQRQCSLKDVPTIPDDFSSR